MARYGQAFRERALARLLPPEGCDVMVLARELDVSAQTLERWRADALARGKKTGGWTAAARLEAVLATAALSEEQMNAWCRSKGVYPAELAEWRQAALGALNDPAKGRSEGRRERGHP